MMGRDLLSLNLVDRSAPGTDAPETAATRWSRWEAYREASGLGRDELFTGPGSERRPASLLWLAISFVLQAGLVGFWLLRSINAQAELPPPQHVKSFIGEPRVVPAPPPPPPPPPSAPSAPAATRPARPRDVTPVVRAVSFEPTTVGIPADDLSDVGYDPRGEPGGVPGGVVGGLVGGLGEPPPSRERTAEPVGPLRIGGALKPPNKIVHVDPVYPDLASYARVEGLVVLEATIDGAGNVENVRVLRSIPLLDDAAVKAVRQWKYEPTIIDGTPVPILMTVTVTFALA